MKNKIIFSTNPDFKEENDAIEIATAPPANQLLYVEIQRLGGGKLLTVVNNFVGKEEDLERLGKLLKSKCGVGGSAKEGRIFIQGDKREQVLQILTNEGYKWKKKGG